MFIHVIHCICTMSSCEVMSWWAWDRRLKRLCAVSQHLSLPAYLVLLFQTYKFTLIIFFISFIAFMSRRVCVKLYVFARSLWSADRLYFMVFLNLSNNFLQMFN